MGKESNILHQRGGARGRIMDIAQEAVLAKGFEATSIEEIVAAAGITKSGFFYHFPDKTALARALLERYLEQEEAIFDDVFGRAAELSDDPLQILLIALKLLAEVVENLPEGHPGCLVATTAYQDRLFDAEVRALNREGVAAWSARFKGYLEQVVALYQPKRPVDLDDLADMVTGVCEGGIVLQKALGDRTAMARQILLLRTFIAMLFK